MDVKSPHALVIPFSGQGHVITLMELSYWIDHGFRITFVNTESIHDRVMASMPKMNGKDKRILLVTITDGLAPGENRKDVSELCLGILEAMPQALEGLIGSINKSDDDDKIGCLITDAAMGWAVSVVRKMGIPNAAF